MGARDSPAPHLAALALLMRQHCVPYLAARARLVQALPCAELRGTDSLRLLLWSRLRAQVWEAVEASPVFGVRRRAAGPPVPCACSRAVTQCSCGACTLAVNPSAAERAAKIGIATRRSAPPAERAEEAAAEGAGAGAGVGVGGRHGSMSSLGGSWMGGSWLGGSALGGSEAEEGEATWAVVQAADVVAVNAEVETGAWDWLLAGMPAAEAAARLHQHVTRRAGDASSMSSAAGAGAAGSAAGSRSSFVQERVGGPALQHWLPHVMERATMPLMAQPDSVLAATLSPRTGSDLQPRRRNAIVDATALDEAETGGAAGGEEGAGGAQRQWRVWRCMVCSGAVCAVTLGEAAAAATATGGGGSSNMGLGSSSSSSSEPVRLSTVVNVAVNTVHGWGPERWSARAAAAQQAWLGLRDSEEEE